MSSNFYISQLNINRLFISSIVLYYTAENQQTVYILSLVLFYVPMFTVTDCLFPALFCVPQLNINRLFILYNTAEYQQTVYVQPCFVFQSCISTDCLYCIPQLNINRLFILYSTAEYQQTGCTAWVLPARSSV